MKIIDSLVLAIKSLFVNKLRSSLTMLGIIIGVGSVITLMSVGRGAQASITSTFEELGTNQVYVMSQTPGVKTMAAMQMATYSLTISDAEAITDRIPSVIEVAPVNENYVEIVAGDESTVSVVEGTTPAFERVYNYPAASGRFISDRDVATRETVVVLGSKVAEDLFGDNDPVGQKVKISGHRFTVIGVLEAKGGQMMGISMDEIIVLPLTTLQARLFPRQSVRGEEAVQSFSVQVASAEAMDAVIEDIEDLLRKRHRIDEDEDDDFGIFTQEQVLGIFEQITGIFTVVLGAIASISLIVGGIGIMNIMLVSVTERTREIGIRKAVGAKRRDILLQFLFEAGVLSLVGGAIGITGGCLISGLISRIETGGITLHTVVSPDIVILAISVSVFVGLASGMYPAMRASRLNPIDALHYG
ncbi:MAG TPA: ABC transporter permease [Dehalococcoidales bacterium]|nr:ABC transporter permease [Dehalococcoidales bacterium]